ncbi:unnamed protein product [Amaranthus hypochondriacus]
MRKVPNFQPELSAGKYNEQYDSYMSKIATSQFPTNKPLWEHHVINCPKGHHVPTIFIFKFNHAIGDGTSLMAGANSCLRRVDDPSLPPTFPSKKNLLYIKPKKNTTLIANVNNIINNYFLIQFHDIINSYFGHSWKPILLYSYSMFSLIAKVNNIGVFMCSIIVTNLNVGKLHYGSIILIEEPCRSAHLAAMKIVKNASGFLSYDPNLRKQLWPSEEAARGWHNEHMRTR